jgi:CubicO group peptidase (beta-lactamase class C family)
MIMDINELGMITKRNLAVIIITFIVTSLTSAQLNESQLKTIDSLVVSWNIPDAPGGVVGIMEHGKLLYKKSFGLASLEYNIPNTENTVFNIGSISKQFTAMGIVKLQLDGKLSIDDDIRKVVPELPDFGHKITLRHLLHHTSGLRDFHSMLSLAGWRTDDPTSTEDLFRFIKKQKELNFNPGDEYMYSNTGYMIMAKIIEVVTGENFKDWMRKMIFAQLGMEDTYIEDLSTRVSKNNATSYIIQNDNSYSRAVEFWNYVGSGNVHTSVKDLLLWLNNYSNPPNEWKSAFEMLQTTDTLNSGKILKYAYGIEIDSINGVKRISHGGGIGGFRSFACTFPDECLSIAVLTNYSSSKPQPKVDSIAKIVLPHLAAISDQDEKPYEGYKAVYNDHLDKYKGDYWDGDVARRIYVRNDTLWYFRKTGNESPLEYIGNDEFIIMPKAIWKVKFSFKGRKVQSMLVESSKVQDLYKPFIPVEITNDYLSDFEGKYYSPELTTYYIFSIKNDTLVGYHPRHDSFKIEAQVKRDFFKSKGPFQTICFMRDENRKIIGMRVSFDRVKNLWLEKVK